MAGCLGRRMAYVSSAGVARGDLLQTPRGVAACGAGIRHGDAQHGRRRRSTRIGVVLSSASPTHAGDSARREALTPVKESDLNGALKREDRWLARRLNAVRGVVWDMDGTMVQANIDFKEMRERTTISVGDLFSVMQQWTDEAQLQRAMDVINEMELGAQKTLRLMHRLRETLDYLDGSGMQIALVTRNTSSAVQAFFSLLGERHAALFSVVLTREFRYVKPDKRLMIHIAQKWNVEPHQLLMVGDSREDVEVANAAGSTSCLVAGGGNDGGTSPLAQGEPTLTISSLYELVEHFERAKQMSQVLASSSVSLVIPAPMDMMFIDELVEQGVLSAVNVTYPRLRSLFRAADDTEDDQALDGVHGDKVLHYSCGDGLLTKLFGSLGLDVVGGDHDSDKLELVALRGLPSVRLERDEFVSRSERSFDAAVVYGEDWLEAPWWATNESSFKKTLSELSEWVRPGGKVVVEIAACSKGAGGNLERLRAVFAEHAGFNVDSCSLVWRPRIVALKDAADIARLNRRLDEGSAQVAHVRGWDEVLASEHGGILIHVHRARIIATRRND